MINNADYEKIIKDLRTHTHKLANDIFINRREVILKALNLSLNLNLNLKKGPGKKPALSD